MQIIFDDRKESAGLETSSIGVVEDVLERRADFRVTQRIGFHATPLPDADTLSAYATLIPDGADRIMRLVERESEHRFRQESAEARHVIRGHWMAYTFALLLSGGGIYLGLQGDDWLAAALFTTTIGAVITTLVAGRESPGKQEDGGAAST